MPVSRTCRAAAFCCVAMLVCVSPFAARSAEPVLTKFGRRSDGLPIVIAHRGSSGERPEHTRAAYQLALQQGADLIEMDLQLTRDGMLVGLHDAVLDRVTDVAEHPEFAERRKANRDGKLEWRVSDFSFAELRSLRVRHLAAGKPTEFDRQETVPTFAEQIALVRAHNEAHKTRIGLCPELKSVSGHKALGLDLEAAFLKAVREYQLEDDPALPVVVQCFELESLERLKPKTKLPLAFLTGDRPTEQQLGRIMASVNILAVNVKALQADDSAAWIRSLHEHGLGVIAWTYKNDVPAMKRGIELGLDGYFTDYPAAGIAARN